MHYGLTTVQIRKLAYEYTKASNLKYPTKWDENQMAGVEWIRKYRERNTNLSLRKPEKTSAARSFAFNKRAVQEFYNNLAEVLQRHNFAANRIFNFDESGVSTVLETPKILAPKSQKQVGQIVSAEKGKLLTFGAIISASGNTIPPLFVFPLVHYRDHFLEGAPEGSLGAANRGARDNGIIFVSFLPHTIQRLQPLDVAVFGPFKAKLKVAFNNWHISNPGKTVNIYNIHKLIKLAYFDSFTVKNITSAFEKPGIWPFNEMAFSDEDFAPIDVNNSNNSANVLPNPETSTVALESQHSTNVPSTDMNEPDIREKSPSLLQNPQDIFTGTDEPSTSATKTQSEPSAYLPVTPEVIRPYPTVVRNRTTNKGRKPGKSRIYTDTPEKTGTRRETCQKELKKIEQKRKARAKAVKRSFSELNLIHKKKKAKQIESDEDSEESEGSQFSLRESLTSPIDFETDEEIDDHSIDNNLNVTTDEIKDNYFVLVKFERKTSVVYYVEKVLSHYSGTGLKVSYLRKKSGSSWSFFFTDIDDIHTLYITDVAMILPDPQPRALEWLDFLLLQLI